jgi:hypothetical protein
LSALSRAGDEALSAKQREIPIPSLQEDIEDFSEASSFFRSKRNAMEKHRFYSVRDQAINNLTTQLKTLIHN